MSVHEHKKEAPKSVRVKVVTVSDTRDESTDKSGQLVKSLLTENGHVIADYCIVKDEAAPITEALLTGCNDENIDVVIFNGGTGVCKRDVTIETIEAHYDKHLVGFGEIFRMLSYTEDIGSAAILSRASAGVVNDTAVFSTPGSSGAVKLAMNKLIIPELGHVIRELRK